jgi:P27 family predicted phage terminase small subunit
MKRGRKPTPTQRKLVEGNRSKRPLNRKEPTPALLDDLTAPDWLDEYGVEFWNENAPMLHRLRLLSEMDGQLLAVCAERWSVYRRAANDLKNSLVQETEANGRVARPEIAISKAALADIRSIFSEFGVGPSSRTKAVALPETKQADPAAKYFRR